MAVAVCGPSTLLFLLVATYADAEPSRLGFDSEVIDITIQGDRCIITGDYHLANRGSAPGGGTIYYPFALGADLPFPDSMSVIDLATGLPIPHARTSEGIRFPVRIAPFDSISLRVVYAQQAPERRARYILTTTQRWGRPLRSADFLIRIPDGLELTQVSIPPDSMEHAANWRIYRIHRSQFMPACDLDLTWREVE